MEPRSHYAQVAPGAVEAMRGLVTYVRRSGLEPSLLDLVKTRASQINGWNRLAVAFRTVPGTYQPPAHLAQERMFETVGTTG